VKQEAMNPESSNKPVVIKPSGARPKPSFAKPAASPPVAEDSGLAAAARVIAAGGRVPKKFAKATVRARPASAGPTMSAATATAKITPARRVAFEILTLVGQGKGHSDELLNGVRMEELSVADKHLATALVMGVLRWQIALDAILRRLLQRPDQRLHDEVAIALRLGAFQLRHMDRIPAHAALSESVEMCRAAGEPHAAGMVNAILRKVAAMPKAKQPIFETVPAFAERLGHPLWLVERWVADYGRDAALAICEAGQREPDSGGLFAPDETLPHIDDGSRLVAEIAAAALPAIEGRAPRVWDCCAAPGGKTLILAARLPAAEILATDVSAKRLGLMQARLRRYSFAAQVKTEVADAAQLSAEAGEFDLILCDVPCSGTGTLGRNPEIRFRLRPEELTRQATRQSEILAAAFSRLAPGGRLVYSTCSLEAEENQKITANFGPNVRQIAVADLVSRLQLRTELRSESVANGTLRTLPGVDPCDGFYAVVLERPAN
jgi:16S rRNA (cytosine967-C5)-methyltransferase